MRGAIHSTCSVTAAPAWSMPWSHVSALQGRQGKAQSSQQRTLARKSVACLLHIESRAPKGSPTL